MNEELPTISTDYFIRIAAGKKVCQDHAVAGKHANITGYHYGIVADGCSNAPQSEAGALALVESLEPYLYPACNFTHSFLAAVGRADVVREVRRKERSCLRATMLCTTLHDNYFYSAIGADGYEVYRRRGTNIFEVRHVEFTANTPPYPVYFVSEDIHAYQAMCNQKENLRVLSETTINLDNGDIQQRSSTSKWSADEICVTSFRPIAEYDLAMVFSDGLSSFRDENAPPDELVPVVEVLKVFLPFKGVKGEFLQRRMVKAFEEAVKRGWKNTDDFSVAGISHA